MAENIDGQKRYECDFVETLPKYLECSICLNVLREPKLNLNDCCGQHFCQACIQRIIDDNKPCPLCNEANFTVILDKKTQRKILELLVKCRRHQSGCEWVGELKSLEEHRGVCEYVEVDCPNSCGEKIQRRLRSYHLESECPKRHFVCTYCGHESTHGDITTEHWPTCEQFPISCKNLCGAQNIPRSKEEAHRLEDCPLHEVECKYKYVGCEEKVKRKDIDAHMEMEMKKHLELTESHAEELKEKNEKLRKMIDDTQSSSIDIFKIMLETSTKLDALKGSNCVYTQKVSFRHVCKHHIVHRSGVFSPLYDKVYRMQFWVYPCEGNQLAVEVGVLGGNYPYNTTWPLKAIVAVELVHPHGAMESVSQSKMGVWHEPRRYSDTNRVTFEPFVSMSLCEHYAAFYSISWCSLKELKFKIYLCQPVECS